MTLSFSEAAYVPDQSVWLVLESQAASVTVTTINENGSFTLTQSQSHMESLLSSSTFDYVDLSIVGAEATSKLKRAFYLITVPTALEEVEIYSDPTVSLVMVKFESSNDSRNKFAKYVYNSELSLELFFAN